MSNRNNKQKPTKKTENGTTIDEANSEEDSARKGPSANFPVVTQFLKGKNRQSHLSRTCFNHTFSTEPSNLFLRPHLEQPSALCIYACQGSFLAVLIADEPEIIDAPSAACTTKEATQSLPAVSTGCGTKPRKSGVDLQNLLWPLIIDPRMFRCGAMMKAEAHIPSRLSANPMMYQVRCFINPPPAVLLKPLLLLLFSFLISSLSPIMSGLALDR